MGFSSRHGEFSIIMGLSSEGAREIARYTDLELKKEVWVRDKYFRISLLQR